MAGNPLLALQVQSPDIAGSYETGQTQASTQRTARLSSLIEQYKLDAAQRADAQANKLQQFYQANGAGIAAGDPTALSSLAAIDPNAAIETGTKLQTKTLAAQAGADTHAKSAADTAKSKYDLAHQQLDFIGAQAQSILSSPAEFRPMLYSRAIAQAKAMGIDTSNVPQDYSDAAVQQMAQGALSAKDQITAHEQSATLAETTRAHKASEATAAQQAATAAAALNKPIAVAPGSVLTDPRTGQPIGGGPTADAVANLHGDDYLKTIPSAQATEIKALAEGRLAFPTGMSLARLQPLIQQVGQYDPTFDAVNYNARSKTRADVTSGKSAQNITALSTAIGHLGQLYDQIDNVAGHSGFPGATIVNAAQNALTQSSGIPGVTNYKNNLRDVSDEVTRAFRQAGGSESEISGRLAGLSENLGSEDKRDAIKGVIDRLESRLDSIKQQAQQGMGTDKIPLQFITPKAQETIDRIRGGKTVADKAKLPDGVTEEDIQHTLKLHPETTREQLLQKLGGK